MIQQKLMRERDRQPIPNTTYGKPQYTAVKDDRQRIELSRGCPHNCDFCYEPEAKSMEEVKQFSIPELKRNYVEILDMNFLWQPNVLERIKELSQKKVNGKVVHYEEICGFDRRLMNQEICDALKEARFQKPRIAWDGSFKEQKQVKKTVQMLKKAGYQSNIIMLFMIVNWKIPYEECLRKLDLMKVWGVQVADCCYDGGYANAVEEYWTVSEIREIRRKCRKHNQLVNFGIDPEEFDIPDTQEKLKGED
ncbi:hypothetical protein AKJ56_00365 [candidate division MSBL1 archaeon SCGC-AAA382N08]|uniref:Radical SAM core domain-containing protein n=1 Tax=candidate division MSBL1 archaeon SCGC-AAA382N08 TaxID=1698285 RepID=A0A133VQM6_9EURY|nr:hypothetical protein AKJ56_00365 [candidate division MSBL1 archaeon SCGC-AAA382N08]